MRFHITFDFDGCRDCPYLRRFFPDYECRHTDDDLAFLASDVPSKDGYILNFSENWPEDYAPDWCPLAKKEKK